MTQQKQISENLVLVGATDYDYVESLKAFIQNKQFVWSAWSFRIREEWRQTISERIKINGKFPLFLYLSKSRGGTGTVEDIAVVSDIQIYDTPMPSPDKDHTNPGEEAFPTADFKSYTWFKFSAVDPVPIELRNFRDIDTEEPLHPSQLISSFGYASLAEEPELSKASDDAAISTAISVERDLRKYLVQNLSSLEPCLKLYEEEGKTGEEFSVESGRMRIDILALDPTNNYVVVELKAGVADLSTFGQISAYMGWVKKNLAKNKSTRGIIVANDFDDKVKYAANSGTDVKLKRYKLQFQFGDENL